MRIIVKYSIVVEKKAQNQEEKKDKKSNLLTFKLFLIRDMLKTN